jgi:hypothetical protein
MRNATVILLLASAFVLGCSRERSGQAQDASTSAKESSEIRRHGTEQTQRHIYLSSTDLAKELNEHCGKASAAIDRASERLSGSSPPNMKQLAAEVAEAKQNMAACMKMVHGVEENAFGAAAEPENSPR